MVMPTSVPGIEIFPAAPAAHINTVNAAVLYIAEVEKKLLNRIKNFVKIINFLSLFSSAVGLILPYCLLYKTYDIEE